MKTCIACKQVLPLGDFHRRSAAKDGHQSTCKGCKREWWRATRDARNAAARDYRRRNGSRVRENERKRYYRDDRKKKSNQRWVEANREQKRAAYRAYYAADPEKQRARQQRFRMQHPDRWQEISQRSGEKYRRSEKGKRQAREGARRRRAVQKSGLNTEAYSVILERDPCSYCGAPGGEIDHIVPVANGGEHSVGNLTASCRSCNASKAAKPLLHFLRDRLPA